MDELTIRDRAQGTIASYVEDDAPHLRDLDFTDLYVSESGAANIRNLTGEQGPLVEVPEGAIGDLGKLHQMVCAQGQTLHEFPLDFDGVRYRVSKIDGQDGVWYAMRRLIYPIPRFSGMGIQRTVYQELGRLGQKPSRGLILVAGPTGNGKTTTASSLLAEYLIHYGDLAVTIEDPPELRLEGQHGRFGKCIQTTVSEGDFSRSLRATLRYGPRYIFLGEIRDPGAASEALRAAISGHVVIATIHGGSIEEAITSVLKLVSSTLDLELARQMLSDGLAAVLYQELKIIRTTDGQTERRPSIKTLFVSGDAGLRAKIRAGEVHKIATEIEAQLSRSVRGEPPIPRRRT